MRHVDRPLPNFKHPPVVEVALSVQFDTLPMRVVHVGLLWSECFKDDFPKLQDKTPLKEVFETFNPPASQQPRIEAKFLDMYPPPRCWFLNDKEDELIQIQQDRFIHNWRKVGDEDADKYPRYETIRKRFVDELRCFEAFVEKHDLGSLEANQCEITYVNRILPAGAWSSHGQLGHVLTIISGSNSDDFLPTPEDIKVSIRYIIKDEHDKPIGRLHVSAEPAFTRPDDEPAFILKLTARGKPLDSDVSGIMDFLDIGREQIVRGFTSITTQRMHDKEVWERQDV